MNIRQCFLKLPLKMSGMFFETHCSVFALAAKYHIEPHDVVRSSVARINDSFWFYFFSELV